MASIGRFSGGFRIAPSEGRRLRVGPIEGTPVVDVKPQLWGEAVASHISIAADRAGRRIQLDYDIR